MAGSPFEIDAVDEHLYLARVRDSDDEFTFQLRLTDDIVDDLGGDVTNEDQVVTAIVAYLLSRQAAFDLPDQIEVQDVPAAYPDFIEIVRRDVLTRSLAEK